MLGDPRLVNGVKPDASIYTQLSDGTVFEVRRGAWYVPGTNQLAMSANKKSQTDVISRVFQLNQRMAFPESFAWRQQWAALQRGENNSPVEVSCHNNADLSQTTPPGYGGCCMDAANLLKTCFDENSRTLFLRSRITDQRGHWWTSAVDTGAEQRLMQKKQ